MQSVKAVTHRHPTFLKEAYKMDDILRLVNDERFIAHGDRFIRFDPEALSFCVLIKTTDRAVLVRKFNNLHGAINCARRV